MSRHRSAACLASLLIVLAFAPTARAQGPWMLNLRPGAPLTPSVCTPVRLEVSDPRSGQAPRNPAGQLVSIADFDMTVDAGRAVVGRYDGAAQWSACACPGSVGATAKITARYPAKALAERARVPGVAFESSITVQVVAGPNSGVPIGCGTIETATVAAGRDAAPWIVTLASNVSALPIGVCTPIQIDLRDAAGKDAPRNPASLLLSLADFDWSVTAPAAGAVAGQSTGAAAWSVCGCQGAAVGTPATITATYPARALDERARVPGVAFTSSITLPLGAAMGTSNPPACAATTRSAPADAPLRAAAPRTRRRAGRESSAGGPTTAFPGPRSRRAGTPSDGPHRHGDAGFRHARVAARRRRGDLRRDAAASQRAAHAVHVGRDECRHVRQRSDAGHDLQLQRPCESSRRPVCVGRHRVHDAAGGEPRGIHRFANGRRAGAAVLGCGRRRVVLRGVRAWRAGRHESRWRDVAYGDERPRRIAGVGSRQLLRAGSDLHDRGAVHEDAVEREQAAVGLGGPAHAPDESSGIRQKTTSRRARHRVDRSCRNAQLQSDGFQGHHDQRSARELQLDAWRLGSGQHVRGSHSIVRHQRPIRRRIRQQPRERSFQGRQCVR